MKPENLNIEIENEEIQACNHRALEDLTASINRNSFEGVRGITDVVRKLAEPMEKFSNGPMMDTLARLNDDFSSQMKQMNLSSVERVAESVRAMTESIPKPNQTLGITDVVKNFTNQQSEALSKYSGMFSGIEQIRVPQTAKFEEVRPHFDNSAIFESFRQEAKDKATQRIANETIVELHEEFVSTTEVMEKSVEIQHLQSRVMQALLDEQKALRVDQIQRDKESKADGKRNFKLNIAILILTVIGLVASAISVYYTVIQYQESIQSNRSAERSDFTPLPKEQMIEIPFLLPSK